MKFINTSLFLLLAHSVFSSPVNINKTTVKYDLKEYKECLFEFDSVKSSEELLTSCTTYQSNKCKKFLKNPTKYLTGISKKNTSKVKTDIQLKQAYLDLVCTTEEGEFCNWIEHRITEHEEGLSKYSAQTVQRLIDSTCESPVCSKAFLKFYSTTKNIYVKSGDSKTSKLYDEGIKIYGECVEAIENSVPTSTEYPEPPTSTPKPLSYNLSSYAKCLFDFDKVKSEKDLLKNCKVLQSSSCKKFYKNPMKYVKKYAKSDYDLIQAEIKLKKAELEYTCAVDKNNEICPYIQYRIAVKNSKVHSQGRAADGINCRTPLCAEAKYARDQAYAAYYKSIGNDYEALINENIGIRDKKCIIYNYLYTTLN